MIEIIIGGSLAFFGFVAGRVRRKPRKVRHEHNWNVSAVQQFQEIPQAAAIGRSKTKVLQTCFCGEFKVEVLDGTWTRENLTAV